jgi:protein SCO1/2
MHNPKLTRTAGWTSLSLVVLASIAICVEPPQRSPEAQVFRVKGIFLQTKGPEVAVIDHETIPDHMPAMVMPFRAARPSELTPLATGDEILFDYIVDGFESWIENIVATGKKRLASPSARATASTPVREPLKVGDLLPDREFLNEAGEPIRLSDSRGKAVALTFVFTRCAMPEACPKMMRNFAAVSEALKADSAAPSNWQLLTISFDSFHDTPEKMKAYGQAYGYDPSRWRLLSSDSCCTIKDIAGDVDLRYSDDPASSMQHNLRTVVLDTTGRITKIFTDETWTVEELVSALREAAKTP